jgi:hypothetical protein
MSDPQALETDALSIPWKGFYGYAFPPFVLVAKVLEKVERDHPCEMILIAPKWPNQFWYARLLDLLVDFPLVLPQRRDLLYQPHNYQLHQSLQAVSLHAWRLSSDPSKIRAFRRKLPYKSPRAVESPLGLSTTANGDCTLVGVVNDQLIHSKSLFSN